VMLPRRRQSRGLNVTVKTNTGSWRTRRKEGADMSYDNQYDETWMHDAEVISLLAEIDRPYERVDHRLTTAWNASGMTACTTAWVAGGLNPKRINPSRNVPLTSSATH